MTRTIVLLLTALALTVAACGDTADTSSETAAAPAEETSAPDTQALEDRIAELEAETKRQEKRDKTRREKAREERRAAQPEPEPEPASSGGGSEGDIIVPDVTGLDHQAAQDAMQGEGLWILDEEDATGQGRLLLFDRNWEVVRTDPPAGTEVSEDTKITIYAKKQGE